MEAFLTLKNYRCFIRPAKIPITKDLTAFVGANNAGKSALLRFLLEFRTVFNLMLDRGHFKAMLGSGQPVPLHEVSDQQEVFNNLTDGPIVFEFEFRYLPGEAPENAPQFVECALTREIVLSVRVRTVSGNTVGGATVHDHSDVLYSDQQTHQTLDRGSLMPILRALGNTLYIGPFRNTVSIGTNTNYLDIQIGEAFIAQFKQHKNGNLRSANRAMLKLTDDIRRIFEFNSLSVDATPDNKSLHLEVNGKPYKQHELGTGLAQFVLVLANASTRSPSYILIDEPELGLHPSLQLDFLTTLATYASEGVWFSTHSLGLARSSTENVYSVRRLGDGDSQVTHYGAIPRLAEFLGEMSFAAHKELGFEQVLLVEGSTDVKAMQQMLRKFGKDHRIVLLSLSGRINGDMVEELAEVMRITPQVSAVIDSERVSAASDLSAQRRAFVSACEKIGITCHVLDRRATENYFPDRAVKAVFGEGFSALQEFQKLEDERLHWPKNQNWKLAHAMTVDEVKSTDLGRFLEGL